MGGVVKVYQHKDTIFFINCTMFRRKLSVHYHWKAIYRHCENLTEVGIYECILRVNDVNKKISTLNLKMYVLYFAFKQIKAKVTWSNDIIQLLTIEALDMMWYRPENTDIDRGEAEVNIGILRSISHHVQCLNSQQLFYYIIHIKNWRHWSQIYFSEFINEFNILNKNKSVSRIFVLHETTTLWK